MILLVTSSWYYDIIYVIYSSNITKKMIESSKAIDTNSTVDDNNSANRDADEQFSDDVQQVAFLLVGVCFIVRSSSMFLI